MRSVWFLVFIVLTVVKADEIETTGDNSPIIKDVNGDVNINYNVKDNHPRKKPLTTFLGVLDKTYVNENSDYVMANAQEDEATLQAGNCSVTGKVKTINKTLTIIASSSDGICSLLNELHYGDEIAEIIPTQTANSGRILKFFLKSKNYAIKSFEGSYNEKDDY